MIAAQEVAGQLTAHEEPGEAGSVKEAAQPHALYLGRPAIYLSGPHVYCRLPGVMDCWHLIGAACVALYQSALPCCNQRKLMAVCLTTTITLWHTIDIQVPDNTRVSKSSTSVHEMSCTWVTIVRLMSILLYTYSLFSMLLSWTAG